MRREIGNQSGKLSSAAKEIQLVTRSGELRKAGRKHRVKVIRKEWKESAKGTDGS